MKSGFRVSAHCVVSIELSRHLPVIPAALPLAQQGFTTGAATRNWASYGNIVRLPPELAPWQQVLLCDPQTSGGLLVSCAPAAVAAVADVLTRFHQEGLAAAGVIGQMRAGETLITVDRAAGMAVNA